MAEVARRAVVTQGHHSEFCSVARKLPVPFAPQNISWRRVNAYAGEYRHCKAASPRARAATYPAAPRKWPQWFTHVALMFLGETTGRTEP